MRGPAHNRERLPVVRHPEFCAILLLAVDLSVNLKKMVVDTLPGRRSALGVTCTAICVHLPVKLHLAQMLVGWHVEAKSICPKGSNNQL